MSKVSITRSLLDDLATSISAKSGEPVPMTLAEMKDAVDGIQTGGTSAISVVDTADSRGGTVRTITALDISDTTAVASDVAQGKYFYTADGTKTEGTSSGGGGGLEYETGTWTPAEDISRGTIYFSNQHDKPPACYIISDCSEATGLTANSILALSFTSYESINGQPIPYNESGNYFRYAGWLSINENTNSAINYYYGACGISYNDQRSPTTSNYSRYWCDETAMYPYTDSTSRYWRAGRTYKWTAIWAPTT